MMCVFVMDNIDELRAPVICAIATMARFRVFLYDGFLKNWYSRYSVSAVRSDIVIALVDQFGLGMGKY